MAPPIPAPKTPGTSMHSPDTRRAPMQPGTNSEPRHSGQTIEVPGRPGVETDKNRDKATGPGGQRAVGNTNNDTKIEIDNPAMPRRNASTNIDPVDGTANGLNPNMAADTDLADDTKPL